MNGGFVEHWRPGDIEWEPAPAENFTGHVLFGPVRTDGLLNVLAVSFAPGARTDWHHHPDGQVLYVTNGAGLVQNEEGSAFEISTGDLIHAPPGEVHWHGALPESPMTHVSHTTGGPTVWEPRKVTDEEYASARERGSRAEPSSAPQATVAFTIPTVVKENLQAQAWTEYMKFSTLVANALERATQPKDELGFLSLSVTPGGETVYRLVSGWKLRSGWSVRGAWSQRFKISQAAADEIDNIMGLTGAGRQDVCRALLYDYLVAVRTDWDLALLSE
ncbi:MAG: cupin domain-containing protein [Acidimicrobiia bacterium]|nr:cupin domain-containing protein [Acidimicrobiia bacterium]